MPLNSAQVERRRARLPRVTYPDLPISERREDIAAAIRDHQVVVVAGETGSGKTTQLPKICLELGRGVEGLIGHTQPRRIAARAVAERVAEELGTSLGDLVGYQVRFTDRTSEDTLVKVMTDGVLLAEISHDPLLSRYDTLIIDEAHERSLTIDFLLGYLRQLLPRRPDLRVIITSATIDPARFAAHFGDAPVIEVSGRTYPVEVRYRPLIDDTEVVGSGERDQVQGICDALSELASEQPGDVLVFLSGEREIRDTADAVRALELRDTEVLPLYGRLSAADQHRVFTPHAGRRVVLSTNVAETSLTVPGIRYVVDPGTARISRYSNRTKVQRLPIEAISQASADQRKGRCGRQADGICIRLYAEEDYLARPRFTEPEILRTSLASVVLQMASLDLGEVADFPFLDPPDARQIRDGVQLLEELGALVRGRASQHVLTPVGRRLARLPVDPRLGRMVIEADTNGCLHEVLVIAAALSIQDPRERPVDREAAAMQSHARFVDRTSDFVSYLNLWDYLQARQEELSSSAFRRLCKAEFLHYLRVREWQDLVSQLRRAARSAGGRHHHRRSDAVERTQGDVDRIHLSLLAGLLSHIGARDGDSRDFVGARGARFALWPGSPLARKPPRFVMAAELVETSRLWGRVVARIEPERVESLAGDLVKRSYSEPHWEKDRGSVVAYEKVTLYGVPLVARRKVAYGRIDPELSRDLFIQHALVEGDWTTHHTFWHDNLARLAELEELEQRLRRTVVVDEETLFSLYDQRIPADVVSSRHFDRWWKQERRRRPELLTFSLELLIGDEATDDAENEFPEEWRQGNLVLPLSYRFEPGSPDDGVTVTIPVVSLPAIDAGDFLWQVPGLREEAVTALVRSLPKAVRRLVVPAPDRARAALARLRPRAEPLLGGLERELRDITGVVIERSDWSVVAIPPHLRMTFTVVDARGATLATGKDLDQLRGDLAPHVRRSVATAAAAFERSGLTDWPAGDVPRRFATEFGGVALQGFPALVDEGESVALRVLPKEAEQGSAHAHGVRRLLLLAVPSPIEAVSRDLSTAQKLLLARSPYSSVRSLLEDCVACAVDSLTDDVPWDAASFREVLARVRGELADRSRAVVQRVVAVLEATQDVDQRLASLSSLSLLAAMADARNHVSALVFDGFVSDAGWAGLADLRRYVQALAVRLERLPERPANDATAMAVMTRLTAVRDARLTAGSVQWREVNRMLEELRVSLWAQSLGTAFPVSEKRVLRAIEALSD